MISTARRREDPRKNRAQLIVSWRIHIEEIRRDEGDIRIDQRPGRGRKGLPIREGVVHIPRSGQQPIMRPYPTLGRRASIGRRVVPKQLVVGVGILEEALVEGIEFEVVG